METAPAEHRRATRALAFFERNAPPGMYLDLEPEKPLPAPSVAPVSGSKACGCGRTISANKASCRACAA
jgi:hypothetical protein